MCQTRRPSRLETRATRGRKSSFVGLLSLIVPELSGGLIPAFRHIYLRDDSVTVCFVSSEIFLLHDIHLIRVEGCLFIRDDVFMVSLVMVKRCLFIGATKKCEKCSVSCFKTVNVPFINFCWIFFKV